MGTRYQIVFGHNAPGAGQTFSVGEAHPITRGGLTMGFSADLTANARDRAPSYTPETRGCVFAVNSGGSRNFRSNLPEGPGEYDVWLALGDAGAEQEIRASLRDGVGGAELQAYSGVTGDGAQPSWIDATAVKRTGTPESGAPGFATSWPFTNAPRRVTFTGSEIALLIATATAAGATALAYLSFEKVDAAPVLSAPTFGTPGTTTITISATSDRASEGTMRFLRRVGGSQASAATIASTGESQAATANPQSRVMTGFTAASANNFVDMVQVGAGGNSNVVTAGPFTMAAGSTPVAFTGTVSAQSGTVSSAFSWAGSALASFFSGSLTPFAYSVVSGSLPPGLTINSSTGVVSGTPTTAGSYAATFRATDTGSNTANSGSVAFTIAAAPPPPPPPPPGPTLPAVATDATGSARRLNQTTRMVVEPFTNIESLGTGTRTIATGTTDATTGEITLTGLGAGTYAVFGFFPSTGATINGVRFRLITVT